MGEFEVQKAAKTFAIEPPHGFYVLTRYEDLREVLKDPATFSNLRPRGPDDIPPIMSMVITPCSLLHKNAAGYVVHLAQFSVGVNNAVA